MLYCVVPEALRRRLEIDSVMQISDIPGAISDICSAEGSYQNEKRKHLEDLITSRMYSIDRHEP